MVINTNISAQSGARLLSESSNMLAKSLARLSSGSKIISPEDDAAGLAVATRFDAQINRIGAASNNISNAISYSQTQDGFLQKVSKALDRMSELAISAQDETKTTDDVDVYKQEFTKLAAYIRDLGTKEFNGVSLFGTDSVDSVTTDSDGNVTTLETVDLTDSEYDDVVGTDDASVLDITTAGAIDTIKTAIDKLASDRADVGANISVLNSYSSQLGVLKDNLTAASSRIKDVDVAEESTNYARANILVQAGTAMLAQANQQPQSVLKLIS